MRDNSEQVFLDLFCLVLFGHIVENFASSNYLTRLVSYLEQVHANIALDRDQLPNLIVVAVDLKFHGMRTLRAFSTANGFLICLWLLDHRQEFFCYWAIAEENLWALLW